MSLVCSSKASEAAAKTEDTPDSASLQSFKGKLHLISPEPARYFTTQSASPDITISRVELLHLVAIKRLTSSLLPIRYPDVFYTEVTHDTIPAELSRVAVFNSKPIGWIRCRLDPRSDNLSNSDTKQSRNAIYIQALCLVAPHRGQGIASMLLDSVSQSNVLDCYDVSAVYAHVWENNEDALGWYERRNFKRILMIEGYYRKLKPGGAWLVRKELR
jgi:N-alpha-acetyltransferase 50